MLKFYFLYFELLSFIVSLLTIKKLWNSYLVFFIPFLFLTNVQEWGSYYGYFSFDGNNSLSLNIFTNIEFIFYSWILYHNTNQRGQKKRIVYFTSFYLLAALMNIVFIQGLNNFHSYSYLAGSLMIIYFVCCFFYELFQDEHYIVLVEFPMFWICTGLLFFYLGMFVYFAFFELVALENIVKYFTLFNIMMNLFNFVLYTCFSIAFVCQKSRKNII